MPVGPDGRTYWIRTDIALSCIFGGAPFLDTNLDPDALRCAAVAGPPAAPKTRPVTVVTIEVRQDSSAGNVLVRESSTFEESSGS